MPYLLELNLTLNRSAAVASQIVNKIYEEISVLSAASWRFCRYIYSPVCMQLRSWNYFWIISSLIWKCDFTHSIQLAYQMNSLTITYSTPFIVKMRVKLSQITKSPLVVCNQLLLLSLSFPLPPFLKSCQHVAMEVFWQSWVIFWMVSLSWYETCWPARHAAFDSSSFTIGKYHHITLVFFLLETSLFTFCNSSSL